MIDFHIHSYFSDGDQTPEEILRIAERRKLSAIAITDHCDISGRFMYLPSVSEPRPLREYIDEIRNLPPNEPVKVFTGLEICDFSKSAEYPPEFAELDFLLIETFPAQTPLYKTFNPVAEAIKLKKKFSFPIGLAHPTLQDIEQNIEQLVQNNIFIELNVDKLLAHSKVKEILQRIAELLHSNSKIQISIGSDAHIIFVIGAVKPIWDFIVANDFLDRLILI
ncbi:MAG: PHP domain-containing protein [Candidatus Helarchaeota archaeon]|nr:PHP domain-containing protein [Candidatus Helarchaeota archaeon]